MRIHVLASCIACVTGSRSLAAVVELTIEPRPGTFRHYDPDDRVAFPLLTSSTIGVDVFAEIIDAEIAGEGAARGLASFVFDLTTNGRLAQMPGIIELPFAAFAFPLTNGGTPLDDDLIQVGGSQNPFEGVSGVVLDLGLGGPVKVASMDIGIEGAWQLFELQVSDPFAQVIRPLDSNGELRLPPTVAVEIQTGPTLTVPEPPSAASVLFGALVLILVFRERRGSLGRV